MKVKYSMSMRRSKSTVGGKNKMLNEQEQ